MGIVVSSSHVAFAAPSSSHSSLAPAWGPSHGKQSSMNFSNVSPSHRLQFFTNCSSMGPFHGVQSFRNRLLQRGSPAGSQVLPENLLQPWCNFRHSVLCGLCFTLQYLMIGFSHFAFFLLRFSDLQADYYAQQIKELEEKFQKKVGEIGQIQLERKLIKEFCRGKASMEKELEDVSFMEISNRRYQELVVRLERRFLEEKVKADRKVVMKALGFCFPWSRQLNSTGRDVFKESVCLHGAFAYQLKETMELKKIKQKLEEDKTVLLQEKETNEGLIRKKILQINRQKAQIGDLQHKVAKLEMALCRMTRESERETQKTQHQALRENQASMVEIKKLQQLLEMKDREMNRVKKLAQNILNERTEVERFFLDALEHVKQEIISSRKHYKKKAQTAYYRKMMEACAGKEEFPKIKTFKSNINSTNSVYRDLEEAEKCYWEKIQFEKVDISELTWEQKERVLRLLFAKMNGTNPRTVKQSASIKIPDY
uniref:Basal body orientation factor 1 n=1 Tax=Aquila chrysaetos chrysaetos TaxID=223781 RepID=A0A663DWR7_AQUCH